MIHAVAVSIQLFLSGSHMLQICLIVISAGLGAVNFIIGIVALFVQCSAFPIRESGVIFPCVLALLFKVLIGLQCSCRNSCRIDDTHYHHSLIPVICCLFNLDSYCYWPFSIFSFLIFFNRSIMAELPTHFVCGFSCVYSSNSCFNCFILEF